MKIRPDKNRLVDGKPSIKHNKLGGQTELKYSLQMLETFVSSSLCFFVPPAQIFPVFVIVKDTLQFGGRGVV